MFRNAKSIFIRKTFRSNVHKVSNKSTIETTTRIASACRVALDDNNVSIMRFRDPC